MINPGNFLVNKEDVEELQRATLGVLCGDTCHKSGVLIVDGVFTDCACMKEFLNKVKYLTANIPRKYWDFTLRNLTKEFTDENKDPLLILQKYRENIEKAVKNGISLYVQGSVGLAKSALSYHILKNAASKGFTTYSIRMSSLTKLIFDSLKESKCREHLEWLKRDVQLLMIDEIDKDYKIGDLNQFAAIQVNEFFNMVYERKKALIVTSNIPKSELGKIHASNVVDRLEELIDIVFTGRSFRKQGGSLDKLFE